MLSKVASDPNRSLQYLATNWGSLSNGGWLLSISPPMHLAQAIILFLHHRQSSHVHTSPVISICSSWSHLNKDTCKHHSMLLPYFKSFTIFYILSGKCPNPSECRRSFVSGSAHVSRLLSSVFPVSIPGGGTLPLSSGWVFYLPRYYCPTESLWPADIFYSSFLLASA